MGLGRVVLEVDSSGQVPKRLQISKVACTMLMWRRQLRFATPSSSTLQQTHVHVCAPPRNCVRRAHAGEERAAAMTVIKFGAFILLTLMHCMNANSQAHSHSRSSTPASNQSLPCATDYPKQYPVVIPSGPLTLPLTATGEVLRLVKDCFGAQLGVARSYNGEDWSGVQPNPLPVSCVAKHCTATIPSDGEIYCFLSVDTSFVPTSANAKAARLLSQSTFGATGAGISYVANTLNGDAASFLAEQFAAPATSLREHYRQRISPKQFADDNFGVLRSGCEPGSRWNAFAFNYLDIGESLEVTFGDVTSGYFSLRIGGELITQVTSFSPGAGTFTICNVQEFRGSTMGDAVFVNANACGSGNTAIVNPPIHFVNPSSSVLDFSSVGLTPHATRPEVVFVSGPDGPCNASILSTFTFMNSGTAFYRHDPRAKIITNSLESPAVTGNGGGGTCPAAARTFLNQASCIRSTSCAEPTFGNAQVTLNDAMLRAWYELSGMYVYYVTGLRLEDPYDLSPCISGVSRWTRTAGTCSNPTAGIDATTLATIQSALSSSTDANPYVRDITLTGSGCTDSPATVGAQIQVGGECFEHVHPNLYDVRDFSYWVLIHDGNPSAAMGGRPNPIAKWADQGLTYIGFPGGPTNFHPMSRWQLRNVHMPIAGRYGDVLDFTQLSSDLQTVEIANFVGAIGTEASETCGSPDEVANIPTLGHWFDVPSEADTSFERDQLDYPLRGSSAKSTVWTTVVANAVDQLRQRVAWTLSQIIVVGDSIGRSDETEPWVVCFPPFPHFRFSPSLSASNNKASRLCRYSMTRLSGTHSETTVTFSAKYHIVR